MRQDMEDKPTIKEMIAQYLRDHGAGQGFAGLICDGFDECSCKIDDLMPCDEPHIDNCRACYEEEIKND